MEYKAVIAKIKVRKHPDADRIQIGNTCAVDVIVGLDTKDGDLGIYFPVEGQLSWEFADANDLVGGVDPVTGKKTGGYFGKNRRVRAQKFRGVNSFGFWIPISSLDFILKGEQNKLEEGTTFDNLGGVPICVKYFTPATIKSIRGQKGLLRRQNNLFAKHFDTEHLKRNICQIPVDSILYFTEKLHGTCLKYNTKIKMSDGTKKNINKIKVGDIVLGYGGNCEVVPSNVLNVFNNGTAEDGWLRIKFDHIGLGNKYGHLICTPEHLIKVSKGVSKYYKKANKIQTGDKIWFLTSDYNSNSDGIKYKYILREVLGVEKLDNKYVRYSKWDIQTETHNFFANDILVHNSGRTGYVLDEYTHKRSLWVTLCCGIMSLDFKRNITSKKYATVTGTRNTILKERTAPGFYGNEEFRGIVEDKLKGLLRKGEIVYYEIVGYTTTGKSIMPGVGIKDKALRKELGKTMSYTYGCKEKQCEIYVYRITNVNEDGISVDLTWPMAMERCKELGVKHVPNLPLYENPPYNNSPAPFVCRDEKDKEELLSIIENLVEGRSTVDPYHIREGVVIRVESAKGVKNFKEKSHTFLVLEGLAKDRDDYCDIEECS